MPEHFGVNTNFATTGEFWFDTSEIAEGFTVDVTVTETVNGKDPISAEYTWKLPELTKKDFGSLSLTKSNQAGKLIYNKENDQVYEEGKGPVDWVEYFDYPSNLVGCDPMPKLQLWYKYREERDSEWTRLDSQNTPLEPGRYNVYLCNSPEDENYKYRESAAIEIAILKVHEYSAQDFTKRYDGTPVTVEDCQAKSNIEGIWLWTDATGELVEDAPVNVSDSGVHYLIFVPQDSVNYESVVIPVNITITKRKGSSSGGSSTSQDVTVPISGDAKQTRVKAALDGNTAVIKDLDLNELDSVINDGEDGGTVTIDFSEMVDISAVELPSEIVERLEEKMNDPDNSTMRFEIVLFDGISIVFDADALDEQAEQANGADITLSILSFEDVKPNSKQAEAVQNRPVYDISLVSDGKNISDIGGEIIIDVPYELQKGEHPEGLVVWYVDENGNKERCETKYHAKEKRVSWKTDHLSLYMIGYEAPAAENMENPFTDVSKDMYYFNAILWALQEGITSGITETAFGPDMTCTRGQMAAFLWRAAGKPEPA
ncbi:MAG: S-layer homology domain-containing protein, partial [Bacillota bacterium]|nr:S-layer homology domain-containing protein [Bacillota bacterium]